MAVILHVKLVPTMPPERAGKKAKKVRGAKKVRYLFVIFQYVSQIKRKVSNYRNVRKRQEMKNTHNHLN